MIATRNKKKMACLSFNVLDQCTVSTIKKITVGCLNGDSADWQFYKDVRFHFILSPVKFHSFNFLLGIFCSAPKMIIISPHMPIKLPFRGK